MKYEATAIPLLTPNASNIQTFSIRPNYGNALTKQLKAIIWSLSYACTRLIWLMNSNRTNGVEGNVLRGYIDLNILPGINKI